MIVLGIDVETTGLDPNVHEIIEIGVVLYDTEQNSILLMENTLLAQDGWTDDPSTWNLDPKITEITGISPQMLYDWGRPPQHTFNLIALWADIADAFLAHNAPFDKKFIEATAKRLGSYNLNYEIPWIDTIEDLDHPKVPSKSLLTLAAYYGFVNPFPHRALTDVLTMLEVFKHYDPEKSFENATAIKRRYIANFGWNCVDFEKKKTFAKENGFKWDPDMKQWYRMIADAKVDEIKAFFADYFDVIQVDGQPSLFQFTP